MSTTRPAAMRIGPLRYATAERFAAPVPVETNERSSGQICPQPPSRLDAVMGSPHDTLVQGEDCLNLVISTPEVGAGRRPVMVWLHGGGFISGAGLMSWYDGARLASEGDVVVVSVNYRLNVFGYLCLPDVSPGNLGLLDQLAALRWIAAHIGEYGGDPTNVTVFGQSAGAVSALLLLQLAQARGLFHRVIMQSGPPDIATQDRHAAERAGRLFVKHLGADPRTADPDDLIRAMRATAADLESVAEHPFDPPFGPVAGALPLDDPNVALEPNSAGRDVLYGWNAEDMSAFSKNDAAALTDETLARPWRRLGQRLVNAGARTSTYLLGWRPLGSPYGATHCVEVPLLLGSQAAWRGSPMLGDAAWVDVDRFGQAMRQAWAGFAHTGTPATEATADWPITWSRPGG